ncbi:NUDIX domain-containing protein [Candidatus Uhrbacteria bacterium]|nr:NUDIX domain-containing protein [Candidatus Uhrbacteria bacterium]
MAAESSDRYRLFAATYLVLEQGSKILLLRRFNTGYKDGFYSLPGGHFNGGETARACMVREASEEVGITIRPEDLTVAHTMHRCTPSREYVDFYLLAHAWEGTPSLNEPDKCDDLQWCARKNLPENLVPEVRQALDCMDQGIPYSEFGW